MEEVKNKYCIRLNSKNQITHFFSSVFETPLKTDILLNEGDGSQFRASSENLSGDLQEYAEVENGLPLMNELGIYQLKYENGKIQKLTAQEIQVEINNLPKPQPTDIEILQEENILLMMTATELYEKNLQLEEQNLDIMLAVAEIYEMSI